MLQSAFPGLIKVSLLPLLLMILSELPKVNGSQKCFPEPTSGITPLPLEIAKMVNKQTEESGEESTKQET